jgi:hypothetical protein
VAVIQISRIQQRRGKRNSTSGVPQLSSAELAWAVDTQELYIGNGSVAEGAPYVGNTRILTEHENILLYASGYVFAYGDQSISGSVTRTIQSKLDEYVSVLDFGAVGDNLTNDTPAFQVALDRLFKNADHTKRKVLIIPNGTYRLLTDLHIPSNAIIRGETANNTILNIGDSTISLVSSNGTTAGSFDSVDRPINIEISNLTINRALGQIDLTGAKASKFENVKIVGDSIFESDYSDSTVPMAAIIWQNDFVGTATTELTFSNCSFDSVSAAVKCVQLAAFKTEVTFDNCSFLFNYNSIEIDGYTKQENAWIIKNCKFDKIYNYAFYSQYGSGTVVQNSTFTLCGNGTNTAAYPISPFIYFGEKINNKVIGCSCDRHQAIIGTVSSTTLAVPEVVNANVTEFIDYNSHNIVETNSNVLTVFSTKNRYIKINYTLTLGTVYPTYSRSGVLTLSIDDSLRYQTDDSTLSMDSNRVSLSDNYEYSLASTANTGADAILGFEFIAVIKDNNNDVEYDTVVLLYKNPPDTGEIGTITYSVTYGV